MRNNLTEWSNLKKNTLVLILNAGDGLIIGELLRRISDETIYAIVESLEEKNMIKSLFEKPVSGIKPKVIVDKLLNPESFKIENLCFENIVGRNVLMKESKKTIFIDKLKKWISEKSYLIFGESVPSMGQRLSDLIPDNLLDVEFRKSLISAEEEIYNNSNNFQSDWSPSTLKQELELNNWNIHRWEIKEFITPTLIRKIQIKKWFSLQNGSAQKSYGKELSKYFSKKEIEELCETFNDSIGEKVVPWKSTNLFMKLSLKEKS